MDGTFLQEAADESLLCVFEEGDSASHNGRAMRVFVTNFQLTLNQPNTLLLLIENPDAPAASYFQLSVKAFGAGDPGTVFSGQTMYGAVTLQKAFPLEDSAGLTVAVPGQPIILPSKRLGVASQLEIRNLNDPGNFGALAAASVSLVQIPLQNAEASEYCVPDWQSVPRSSYLLLERPNQDLVALFLVKHETEVSLGQSFTTAASLNCSNFNDPPNFAVYHFDVVQGGQHKVAAYEQIPRNEEGIRSLASAGWTEPAASPAPATQLVDQSTSFAELLFTADLSQVQSLMEGALPHESLILELEFQNQFMDFAAGAHCSILSGISHSSLPQHFVACEPLPSAAKPTLRITGFDEVTSAAQIFLAYHFDDAAYPIASDQYALITRLFLGPALQTAALPSVQGSLTIAFPDMVQQLVHPNITQQSFTVSEVPGACELTLVLAMRPTAALTDYTDTATDTGVELSFPFVQSLAGATTCSAFLLSQESEDYTYPADLEFPCAVSGTDVKMLRFHYVDLPAAQSGTVGNWEPDTTYVFRVVISVGGSYLSSLAPLPFISYTVRLWKNADLVTEHNITGYPGNYYSLAINSDVASNVQLSALSSVPGSITELHLHITSMKFALNQPDPAQRDEIFLTFDADAFGQQLFRAEGQPTNAAAGPIECACTVNGAPASSSPVCFWDTKLNGVSLQLELATGDSLDCYVPEFRLPATNTPADAWRYGVYLLLSAHAPLLRTQPAAPVPTIYSRANTHSAIMYLPSSGVALNAANQLVVTPSHAYADTSRSLQEQLTDYRITVEAGSGESYDGSYVYLYLPTHLNPKLASASDLCSQTAQFSECRVYRDSAQLVVGKLNFDLGVDAGVLSIGGSGGVAAVLPDSKSVPEDAAGLLLEIAFYEPATGNMITQKSYTGTTGTKVRETHSQLVLQPHAYGHNVSLFRSSYILQLETEAWQVLAKNQSVLRITLPPANQITHALEACAAVTRGARQLLRCRVASDGSMEHNISISSLSADVAGPRRIQILFSIVNPSNAGDEIQFSLTQCKDADCLQLQSTQCNTSRLTGDYKAHTVQSPSCGERLRVYPFRPRIHLYDTAAVVTAPIRFLFRSGLGTALDADTELILQIGPAYAQVPAPGQELCLVRQFGGTGDGVGSYVEQEAACVYDSGRVTVAHPDLQAFLPGVSYEVILAGRTALSQYDNPNTNVSYRFWMSSSLSKYHYQRQAVHQMRTKYAPPGTAPRLRLTRAYYLSARMRESTDLFIEFALNEAGLQFPSSYLEIDFHALRLSDQSPADIGAPLPGCSLSEAFTTGAPSVGRAYPGARCMAGTSHTNFWNQSASSYRVRVVGSHFSQSADKLFQVAFSNVTLPAIDDTRDDLQLDVTIAFHTQSPQDARFELLSIDATELMIIKYQSAPASAGDFSASCQPFANISESRFAQQGASYRSSLTWPIATQDYQVAAASPQKGSKLVLRFNASAGPVVTGNRISDWHFAEQTSGHAFAVLWVNNASATAVLMGKQFAAGASLALTISNVTNPLLWQADSYGAAPRVQADIYETHERKQSAVIGLPGNASFGPQPTSASKVISIRFINSTLSEWRMGQSQPLKIVLSLGTLTEDELVSSDYRQVRLISTSGLRALRNCDLFTNGLSSPLNETRQLCSVDGDGTAINLMNVRANGATLAEVTTKYLNSHVVFVWGTLDSEYVSMDVEVVTARGQTLYRIAQSSIRVLGLGAGTAPQPLNNFTVGLSKYIPGYREVGAAAASAGSKWPDLQIELDVPEELSVSQHTIEIALVGTADQFVPSQVAADKDHLICFFLRLQRAASAFGFPVPAPCAFDEATATYTVHIKNQNLPPGTYRISVQNDNAASADPTFTHLSGAGAPRY